MYSYPLEKVSAQKNYSNDAFDKKNKSDLTDSDPDFKSAVCNTAGNPVANAFSLTDLIINFRSSEINKLTFR